MCADGKRSMQLTDAAKLEQIIEYYRKERIAVELGGAGVK